MFTIQKATTNDIQLINEMAQIVFPATYYGGYYYSTYFGKKGAHF